MVGKWTYTWPILDRYLTDTWPILDRYLTGSWSLHIGRCIGRQSVDRSVDCRPIYRPRPPIVHVIPIVLCVSRIKINSVARVPSWPCELDYTKTKMWMGNGCTGIYVNTCRCKKLERANYIEWWVWRKVHTVYANWKRFKFIRSFSVLLWRRLFSVPFDLPQSPREVGLRNVQEMSWMLQGARCCKVHDKRRSKIRVCQTSIRSGHGPYPHPAVMTSHTNQGKWRHEMTTFNKRNEREV